eukprot:12568607-Ditylum_brightwellii.AAC.1
MWNATSAECGCIFDGAAVKILGNDSLWIIHGRDFWGEYSILHPQFWGNIPQKKKILSTDVMGPYEYLATTMQLILPGEIL